MSRAIQALVAVQEIAGQFQVTALACRSVELHKRHLHFRVAGKKRLLVRPEVPRQVVRELDAGIEQFAVARGAVIGDRSLEHVAEAVELVAPFHRLRDQPLRGFFAHKVRVEIPAGFLDGNDLVNPFLRPLTELRLISRLQENAHRFDPLVRIGVGKNGPLALDLLALREPAEIVRVAVLFNERADAGNTLFDSDFAPPAPEPVLHSHSADRHAAQLRIR